jgi:hypothetical protein
VNENRKKADLEHQEKIFEHKRSLSVKNFKTDIKKQNKGEMIREGSKENNSKLNKSLDHKQLNRSLDHKQLKRNISPRYHNINTSINNLSTIRSPRVGRNASGLARYVYYIKHSNYTSFVSKSPKKLAQSIQQRVETNFDEVKGLFDSLRDLLVENTKLMKEEDGKNATEEMSSRRHAHRETNRMTTSFTNTRNLSNRNYNTTSNNSNNVKIIITL